MQNWEVLEAYFKNRNFAQMQIDSFNQFVDDKLPLIVEENNEIIPKIEEVRIELANIELSKPTITEADGSPRTSFFPMEARIRNRTYAGKIFLTMKLFRRDVEQDTRRAYIGDLPIMLKSKLCWLNGKTDDELIDMGEDPRDFGGYFIVNGSEKALMTQEVLASDRVLLSEMSKGVAAEVISTRGAFRGRVRVARHFDGMLYVTFPASPRKLKLFVLLKALGLISLKDIKDAFPEEKEIENDVLLNWQNTIAKTEEEALDRIGKYVAPGQVVDYRLRRAQEVIDAFLLPHIGQKKLDRLAKAYFLTMMATKSIERHYGLRGEDDKDHYSNKRLELSGKLMEHLFRYSFKYFIKDLRFQIDRTITRRRKLNIATVVRPGAISERIRFAMSTGNWIGRATGVSKFMDRVNYISPLTDLRKVKSPLNKNRELYEARDVHGTHWGRLDPIETPDGPMCVAPETEMLLDDYSSTSIKEFEKIWQEKKIVSIDWENNKAEKKADIARHISMAPNKKVFELQTKESNRKIIASADHPFFSESFGKIALEKLKSGERVAVLPGRPIKFEMPENKTIIGEKEILDACPQKTDRQYILNELKEKGLVPLLDSNEKILALARLLGFIFGDGGLSVSMKKHKSSCTITFAGRQADLQEIRKDIEELGFNAGKFSKTKRVSVLTNGRIISGFSETMHCYSKPLWILFRALGAPVGDKAVNRTKIPAWIMGGRKIIAREFLSGFFGSEMTKPSIDKRNGKIFLQPMLSLNKSKQLLQNALEFAEQLKELLQKFGVKVSHIKIVDGIKRKSGIETKKIKLLVSSRTESLLNLYGSIGFAYCAERKSVARMAYSYLLFKKTMIEKRIKAQEIAIVLAGNGKSVSQIMETMDAGVKRHDVSNWLKKSRKGLNKFIRVSQKEFPKFNDWIREHCISANGLAWETIESIKETECKEVMDITTRQDYHNFFANGFLTGNCGLVKNLCLMAEVTTDADDKPLEELLNRKGVKMRKL